MLAPGLSHTSTATVDGKNTAIAYGSGGLEVFATPAMIGLMENAAMNAVAAHLPEGSATVGTLVNIAHNRATPLGERVAATAILTAVDGRSLVFEVTASDAQGEIGRGTHTRFVVDIERFMGKLKK